MEKRWMKLSSTNINKNIILEEGRTNEVGTGRGKKNKNQGHLSKHISRFPRFNSILDVLGTENNSSIAGWIDETVITHKKFFCSLALVYSHTFRLSMSF